MVYHHYSPFPVHSIPFVTSLHQNPTAGLVATLNSELRSMWHTCLGNCRSVKGCGISHLELTVENPNMGNSPFFQSKRSSPLLIFNLVNISSYLYRMHPIVPRSFYEYSSVEQPSTAKFLRSPKQLDFAARDMYVSCGTIANIWLSSAYSTE